MAAATLTIPTTSTSTDTMTVSRSVLPIWFVVGLLFWRGDLSVASFTPALFATRPKIGSRIGRIRRNTADGSRERSTPTLFVGYDYEYLPMNDNPTPPPFKTDLPSLYPPEAPAGMRGEAVRAALRSGRCICWDLGETPLERGIISVEGKGTFDFLNNKLTQSFRWKGKTGSCRDACLLNAKGRVVDRVTVAETSEESALVLTSPGHAGSKLFGMLDPLIFPMDRVKIENRGSASRIITIASVKRWHADQVIHKYVLPHLQLRDDWKFPLPGECTVNHLASGASVVVIATTGLPEVAASGYTLVFLQDTKDVGNFIFQRMIGDDCPEGPIGIGALEYDTLRIETAVPAYGKEMTGGDKEAKASPGPMEFHWSDLIDFNKGCYLGQEGVASVLKNKRGPPRLLYQVVFDDDYNMYQHETDGDPSARDNKTVYPEVGKKLFVLGSNEGISVGTLTSVAEPGGTGDTNVVAMALVRRADSILKDMKDNDLEISSTRGLMTDEPLWNDSKEDASIMVQPPPMDPLDGLDVVVEGTYTIGVLKCVPTRRYPVGQNMFLDIDVFEPPMPADDEVEIRRVSRKTDPAMYEDLIREAYEAKAMQGVSPDNDLSTTTDLPRDTTPMPNDSTTVDIDTLGKDEDKNAINEIGAATGVESDEDDDLAALEVEMENARKEAEAAAAEAQRKAEKMALLQKRAEEAMARRKKQQQEQAEAEATESPAFVESSESDAGTNNTEAEAEAEAERKAAKMEMLKKRAEEALARRKAKKTGN